MENNKYLEEFKIDLVKQYLQGKQKKRYLRRIRGRKIDDMGMDVQVRRPHTEIVGGQRHRGCRRGIHRHHNALKGETQ